MGFNQRYVSFDRCYQALTDGGLRNYYGKSDGLTFEDDLSVEIYELFIQGKTDEEILSIINNKKNMEEKTNEVYQSNQNV
jgi:hypothetical protein